MTKNYSRLWGRPHKPHRDSPHPDAPSEPVHLYTHQNIHLEEFDPYYATKPHQHLTTFEPEVNQGAASGEENWEGFDSRPGSPREDFCYKEPSHASEYEFDPNHESESANYENSDHFDPREPSVDRQSSPDNDYYYNDQPDGEYYDDGERRAPGFEPTHEEDILEHELNRLDLEPKGQDLGDYPNSGNGVVYPNEHDYECYPDDSEALDRQFQRLDIGNDIIEISHAANKDVFYHKEAGQLYHIECLDCMDYMNQSGFEMPPPGYDYNNMGPTMPHDDLCATDSL